ncbi:hypothetical protein HanHA300_Chr13g0502041 [Helianthus annuus]|nr:hypothetical protein HanHA300_Chr13g0502041 [Helianthus annuus]KAJ0483461.1 hypothetical protein HanIR_Chr13g0665041 [Helianthus annuus]KAJ0665517.1 hypothetical protein HanLR1_Chr13g0504751 [Helianthus annuus]KAJ0672963.1 hypothetical protein HanOQP8_Chr13g0502981 [Helianthus annuus]
MLNSQVTTAQHVEREKAYDIIASLLKIPFLDEEVVNNSHPRKVINFSRVILFFFYIFISYLIYITFYTFYVKVNNEIDSLQMGRVDVLSQQNSKKETVFPWTDVFQKSQSKETSTAPESSSREHETIESPGPHESNDGDKPQTSELKYKEYICGEEAMRISPTAPYCLRRPIRRGHLNISQYYPMQQVLSFFIPLAISILKKIIIFVNWINYIFRPLCSYHIAMDDL